MTTRTALAAMILIAATGLTACGDKKDKAAKARPPPRPAPSASAPSRPAAGRRGRGLGPAGRARGGRRRLGAFRLPRRPPLCRRRRLCPAGQPLAQLDDTLLRAQVEQQAAVTAQAQAEAKRVAGLDGQGVLSQEQIETRRYQAKAQEAALKEMRTRASRMTITAPVGGLVLQRGVQPGQIAGGGTTPWFTIARDGLVELYAEVNEADLAGIRAGQPAQVSLPGGQSVSGVVRLVSPRVDSASRWARCACACPSAPTCAPAASAAPPSAPRRAGDRRSGSRHPLRGRRPVRDDRRQQQPRPPGGGEGRPEGRRLGSAGPGPAGRDPPGAGRRRRSSPTATCPSRRPTEQAVR
jgi:HlyD family secretion protein